MDKQNKVKIMFEPLIPLFMGAIISVILYYISQLFPEDIKIPLQGFAAVIFGGMIIYTIGHHIKKSFMGVRDEYRKARGKLPYDTD